MAVENHSTVLVSVISCTLSLMLPHGPATVFRTCILGLRMIVVAAVEILDL